MMNRQPLLIFLINILFCSVVYAQVSIAPTNLYIDGQQRFGTYLVVNSSTQDQEIAIEFLFGYSKTDLNGEREWVFSDTAMHNRYAISDHIRAFPQNFILPPGQRQVVRLRINAPDDLPDGTYWARIKTSSVPESPPVELSSNDGVAARVTMTVEQVTGLFYKKGNVSTGIEVENIRVEFPEDENLIILTDLKRTGNSPFLGSITTALLNRNGQIVGEQFVSTSIYFDGTHKQELGIKDLAPGEYTLRVHFETRRSDVSSDDLVQMEPVTATTTVTIP